MIQKGDHLIIAGLGLEFATVMCLGFFGGYYLDGKCHTTPLFTLAFSALAFALGIYIVFKAAKQAVEKDGIKK